MVTHQLKPPMQAFQSRTTHEVINIPTTLDPKTGELVILWSDIQDGFENARSIRNGDDLVPLMKDENLQQITPLRISHYPGVVLEVVVRGDTQSHSHPQASGTDVESKDYALSSHVPSNADTYLQSQHSAALSIGGSGMDDQSLSMHSGEMTVKTKLTLQALNQLYGSYFQAILSGQAMQAAGIKQSMDTHFESLQVEMDKNKAL
ncbi:hypothetical protein B0O80DRAFT_502578 [Mortierella sp. GBAus27b]|nr:hypothetical protein B0O80DRAFT_502578 [Mortierella sp. GBAus27b]